MTHKMRIMSDKEYHQGYKASSPYITKNIDRFTPAMEIAMLEQILEAIQSGITKNSKTITHIETGGGDASNYDEELEMIENLLGVAFVTCQVYITSVVSMVNKARAKKSTNSQCQSFSKKKEILRYENSPVKTFDGTAVTQIQLIDTMANYYKHRDEWKLEYKQITSENENYSIPEWKVINNNEQTIKVLKAIRVKPNSSGNLRRAAETLGNKDYDVRIFAKILSSWSNRVKEKCQELS